MCFALLVSSAVVMLVVGTPTVAGAGNQPKPTVTDFSSDPSSLPFTGGDITLSGNVTNASSCTFIASNPRFPVSGLPATVPCSDGGVDASATIAVNPTARAVTYHFELTATGPGGTKTGKLKIVLPKNRADCKHPGPGVDLEYCNFSDEGWSGVDWDGADLTGANLMGTDLAGAALEGATFTGANLSYANLSGSNAVGAVLTDANVSGANLDAEYLENIQSGGIVGTPSELLEYYELIGGYLIGPDAALESANLPGVDLSGLDLTSANLNGADLDGADLSGAGASFAVLVNSDLADANLTGTDLSASNLSGATMTGAILTDVTWDDTTCPDDTNSNDDGDTCINNLA